MIDQQGKMWRGSLVTLVTSGLFAALLLGGCGNGDKAPAAAASKPAGCRVGASILPLVAKPSTWWTEGEGPTLALACLHDPPVGDAALVGYASPEPGGGRCVNAYNLTGDWSAGEKCAAPGYDWSYWCKAQGCVWGVAHNDGVTGVAGPLEATVKKVEILVRGRPLKRGVMVAQVDGKTAQSIGGEKPFGFFAAFIRGCVQPQEVKVELLGAAGSRIGAATDRIPPESCPKNPS